MLQDFQHSPMLKSFCVFPLPDLLQGLLTGTFQVAIYHLDNPLSDLEPEGRKKQRQMTVKPLVGAFFAWAKEVESAGRLPKGKTLEGSKRKIASTFSKLSYVR